MHAAVILVTEPLQMVGTAVVSHQTQTFRGTYSITFIQIMIDINECSEGTSGCSHICNNIVGSYNCMCPTGYQLASNNHTCMGESG